jgi:hypothetical protein
MFLFHNLLWRTVFLLWLFMCRGNLAAIPTERIYLQLTINVICLYRHPRIHVIETRDHLRCSGGFLEQMIAS